MTEIPRGIGTAKGEGASYCSGGDSHQAEPCLALLVAGALRGQDSGVMSRVSSDVWRGMQ